MDESKSLNHTKWECKYHVVFIPKYRRKALYKELRRHLGEVLRQLAKQKESQLEEGHLLADHVHLMIAIPPKYAVSQVIGYVKGKSAIHLARVYGGRKQNFVGQHFWARGYYVSTVGRDEEAVRKYIREQDEEDKRLDQWGFGNERHPNGGASSAGPRERPRLAALSGSHTKAPGFAGGYLRVPSMFDSLEVKVLFTT